MKKIRISFKSFEKSLNAFVEKRIIGLTKEEGISYSEMIDTDVIRNIAKKLVLKYKSDPHAKKSGFTFKPEPVFLIRNPNPVNNFLLTWNFDGNSLYFKFFVRFKNGHKNKRFKQMKINF
jgi:hypothetical protein